MSDTPQLPLLRDVVIHGDELRPKGYWLPLQEVGARPAHAPRSEPDVAKQAAALRAETERILPAVRERVVAAGVAAARSRLHGTNGGGDGEREQ